MEKTGYNKWKDPDWLKQYRREKNREHRPLKRHPNILDDGSKWSDHYPCRETVTWAKCHVCSRRYNVDKKERHDGTKYHKHCQDVLNKFNQLMKFASEVRKSSD